jgi:hypothetical protein
MEVELADAQAAWHSLAACGESLNCAKNIPQGLKSVRENGLPELEKNSLGSKAAS